MVKVSTKLKDSIGAAATARDMNMSEFVRSCVAKEIGYNLQADNALDGRGRPRTYQTDDQRKSARRRQEQMRTEQQRKIVDTLMRQERLEGIEALEAWLVQHGVSLDDEEVAQTA